MKKAMAWLLAMLMLVTMVPMVSADDNQYNDDNLDRGEHKVHEYSDGCDRSCNVCGAARPQEQLRHSYNAVVTAPDCANSGYTTYTCSNCGDSYIGNEVAALGHNYDAVVTAPDCENGGYTTYTCSVCGDSYVDDQVAALGHNYDESGICEYCGEKMEIPDVPVEPDIPVEPDVCNHTWTAATCTEPKTCSVCGETEGEALDHDMHSDVTIPATCEETGILTYWCPNCDYQRSERIPVIAHTSDKGTVTKKATCTATGTKTYKCTSCKTTLKTEKIAKIAHTSDKGTVTKKATCTATGTKTYKCTACGTITKTETIAKIAHSYNAATCTKAKTCKLCGVTSGKALGHDYVIDITDPDCTIAGCTSYTCSVCGDHYTDNVIAALGHKYTNACDATCNICAATRSVTHKYTTVTKKATTTANGYTVKRCSVCKKETGKKTIYKASTIKLSKTTYVYNGKVQKPSVVIKASNGKTISTSNYTVTYASGLKNVGTYKVTVKMKGNYSGTKTLTFKINPVATSISKLTAAKKGFKVAITKKSAQVTGYEVQYATSKTFKSYKSKLLTSYSKTSLNLTGLKAKTTYYVRVRTYKVVNGKKVYSAWSTVKSVKTK